MNSYLISIIRVTGIIAYVYVFAVVLKLCAQTIIVVMDEDNDILKEQKYE